MSATVLTKVSDEETRMLDGETLLATRAADFEELFRDLVEESGRALEEGYLEWCAILQEYLIPKIEAECLRARRGAALMPESIDWGKAKNVGRNTQFCSQSEKSARRYG